MTGRFDLARSAIALFAAFLAGIGAWSATSRSNIPFAEFAVVLLAAEAVAALALALWPGRPWSFNRRLASLGLGLAGLVLMVPGPLISAIAVPGCICPSENLYGLLGISHQYWMIAGLLGAPLAFIAASIGLPGTTPDERPPEPEASSVHR